MSLQPLFVFVALSFFLSIKPLSILAQTPSEEAVPESGQDSGTMQIPASEVLFRPSRSGRPPNTRGAGSRNDRQCPQDSSIRSDLTIPSPALTALVPAEQGGLTWAERPTVWVYIPETSARQIVLSVQDEDAQPHAQRFIPITGEEGIVGLSLDAAMPPLAIAHSYQWAVVLVCGDRPSPNDPFVTAWIRRETTLDSRNTAPDPIEQAIRYGEQGIWYDALTTLAEARRSRPNDPSLAEIWANFLSQTSVGLSAIASEPLQ